MNEELLRIRELNVLSRTELSELSGVDEITIYRLDSGRTLKVRPSTIRKLASALKVEPLSLMSVQPRFEL